MARTLLCVTTDEMVDREHNAAKNLSDWPELNASSGPVRSSAIVDTQVASGGGTDPGSEHKLTRSQRRDRKTHPQGWASRGKARVESQKGKETPQGEAT